MSVIPSCFTKEEDTITLPALKRFLRDNDEQVTADWQTLIDRVEGLAEASVENYEKVQCWLDYVLKEGKKDLYVAHYSLDDLGQAKLNDDNFFQSVFSRVLSNGNKHVCEGSYSGLFTPVYYSNRRNDRGRILSFCLCKNVRIVRHYSNHFPMIYPIFIDIYTDYDLLVIRATSKSDMYVYREDEDFKLNENAQRTSVSKEVTEALKKLEKLLGLEFETKECNSVGTLRNKLYQLIDKFTQTPKEIVCLMNENKENQNQIIGQIMSICCLNQRFYVDVQKDISNLIEKYYSISWEDKTIFTRDREAYPLIVAATDEEESKVEEQSSLGEPLQSKAVFFDNKKMLQNNQSCDSAKLRYQRIYSKNLDKTVDVIIKSKGNEFCTVKFTRYTMEEDIDNVLFSFVGA